MIRRLQILGWCAGFILLLPQAASAAWGGGGGGSGASKADALPGGPTPTVTITGRNAVVSWSGVSFGDGQPIGSYRVARYPAAGGAADTIQSACTGTISGLTCTEGAVPAGSWRYGITPVRNVWDGAEGALSAAATIGASTFTFDSGATLLALPAAETGSLANFATGETVAFRLDSTSGTLLTGSTTPGTIAFAGTATTSTTIPAGTSDGTHSVYALGSLGSTASATVQIDLEAPAVTAAAIGKTEGGTGGFVRQNGTYYVYANVTDAGSNVSTVRADVSTVTGGATSAVLTAGAYTADGVSYGFRSAALSADNPLAAGATTFSITATDANGHSGTTGGFSVTVDNTGPRGTDVEALNSSGGIVGRAETGDSAIFTFSEPMDPSSIVAGWNGLTSQTVTLRLIQNASGDRVQIWDAANAVRLPLGQIRLGGTGYTTTTVSFTGATMTMSGATITVVLGAPSGAVTTASVVSTMRWTPSSTATDRAANACSSMAVNEPPAVDAEF